MCNLMLLLLLKILHNLIYLNQLNIFGTQKLMCLYLLIFKTFNMKMSFIM